MNTLHLWILGLLGFGLFIYFIPYKNIQRLQKDGLQKLDTIIELLKREK